MTTALLQSQLPVTTAFREEYLAYYRFLPLELTGKTLRVAIAGVPHAEAMADLSQSYDAKLDLVPVAEDELREAIRRTFAAAESVVDLMRELEEADGGTGGPADRRTGGPSDPPSDPTITDVRGMARQPVVIRFVNLLIRDAYDAGASDVHFEATRDGLRVRLRIDGVLSELPRPPRGLQDAIVSRIKLLAELDIAERRRPQDGRIRVRLESRELDLRIATVPTLFGESVVLRLLDRGGQPVGLDDLGMSPAIRETFRQLARKGHGILLATGPTGAGKTTTLYAALGIRDPSAEKIITVEDPVEYHLPGVTQVPVHAAQGMTFAGALRSLLRQDPDVIMVGEMRDAETASIAVQAALTGHLVFSTLHTNDAVSAVARLVDLKVEAYLVAATVEAVLAQRLVRRICPECRERYRPDPAAMALLAQQPVGEFVLERGSGCGACRQTGYRGRVGLYELFVVTDEVRNTIARGGDMAALRTLAVEQGMTTLRADGWHKVRAGLTTVEE
ncbi:MAG: GspE/PulE family protein, partial [Gemmatimonadota bacterium]|nr:GspE/PulE family protein [Gemmatimonadota bacterium]